MRRVLIGERPDWRESAARNGFHFHTPDGQAYWDESHAYAFTLAEIEAGIEAPSADLHALCLHFVDHAVADERILSSLRIPRHAWDAVRESWLRRDPSLYGRLDFAYDGHGPAKLFEYNADTPTALYETAVFQWQWFEERLASGRLPPGADQYNAVHERLIARFRSLPGDGTLTLTADGDSPEDRGTVAYLEDCARQAGLACRFLDLAAIGLDDAGRFVDRRRNPISRLFKLYPWEWAFADAFGSAVAGSSTRFLEPPWKAILSNKGLLAHLHAMEPNHPNLLPTYFETDPARHSLGASFVRKPLFSREGANILMVEDGHVTVPDHGPYGAEGHIRQALAPLPRFGRSGPLAKPLAKPLGRPLVESWIVGDTPAGLCIREAEGPITGNDALFVPHYIEPT